MSRRAKSTARYISYDLRPAKQSERGILIDILKIAGDCGHAIRNYRYIGMGANRFYEYLLLHKHLGIQKMISIEHDAEMYERALYNAPFKFIKVKNTKVSTFLLDDTYMGKQIYWLDYDGGISKDVIADINSLATRMNLGDFCFITVGGLPPGSLGNIKLSDRYEEFKDEFRDFAGGVLIEDMEVATFYRAVHKILVAAFENAFSANSCGRFVPLLQLEYSDSMSMVTYGGALLSAIDSENLLGKLRIALPFLPTNSPSLYRIKTFNITERERVLFDLLSTSSRKATKERKALEKFGFKDAEFEAYKELLRYLPRYVETAV